MLPDDWDAWARPFRRRPLWTCLPSTQQVSENRHDIQQVVPYRDPFLLLDEIVCWDSEQATAQARRLISPDDPVFAGHFPGDPVYPGVLQVEMAGQLAVWLVQRLRPGLAGASPAVRAVKVHHAVFVSPVLPGERVDVFARILDDGGLTTVVAGQVSGARGIAAVAALELYRAES